MLSAVWHHAGGGLGLCSRPDTGAYISTCRPACAVQLHHLQRILSASPRKLHPCLPAGLQPLCLSACLCAVLEQGGQKPVMVAFGRKTLVPPKQNVATPLESHLGILGGKGKGRGPSKSILDGWLLSCPSNQGLPYQARRYYDCHTTSEIPQFIPCVYL